MGIDLSQIQQRTQAAVSTVANAPAAAQAAWSSATSDAANGDRIVAGAGDAMHLIEHGYDSSNPDDNRALVGAIAAGCSLIPVVGPFLGGSIALLDSVAEGIGSVLTDIGLIPRPGCHSSGTFTMAQMLDAMRSDGAVMSPGSFGALALPALAYARAERANCRPAFDDETILAGLIELWNANTRGPADPHVAPAPNAAVGTPYQASVASLPGVLERMGVFGYPAGSKPLWPLFARLGAVADALGMSTSDAESFLAAQGMGGTIDLNPGPFTPKTVYRVGVGVRGAAGHLAQQTAPTSPNPWSILLVLAMLGGIGALAATRR